MTFTGRIVEDLDPSPTGPRGSRGAARTSAAPTSPPSSASRATASPWSVWAEKVGLARRRARRRAHGSRPLARARHHPWFAHRTGLHVIGAQTVVEAADDPIASCTVDGFVAEWSRRAEIEDALGAARDQDPRVRKRWDPIPADVQAQCQWQMYVTGTSARGSRC
jgi:hypothetical protein